ncbi:hypothetical protein CYMTET_41816 [Cymbomonas tetramitiformis]|uniref:Uncharacterized protein n=1 Tax=Cymbomonas tetramitiformis TaxID=36881 RepID=A0AAE0C7A5_9CHLO|nr:hypothetical protein CYMTET_41816 [Cymbomonas tetramitiformis]
MDKHGLYVLARNSKAEASCLCPKMTSRFAVDLTVDESAKGEINFGDYLKIVETNKASYETEDMETLEAWQALGGCSDTSGRIEAAKLVGLVSDFGLCVDDELNGVVDSDGSISYEKFKNLLSDMVLA